MFHLHQRSMPSEELLDMMMDMEELCAFSSKKEAEAAAFMSEEPDSVLDLGAHLSPLDSPTSQDSSTIFSTCSSPSDGQFPWEYHDQFMYQQDQQQQEHQIFNFNLDPLLSPHDSSISSDLSHQEDLQQLQDAFYLSSQEQCQQHEQLDSSSQGSQDNQQHEQLDLIEDLLLKDEDQNLSSDFHEEIKEEDSTGQSAEKRGLQIVHLLLACVEHIQEGSFDTAKLILDHLAASSPQAVLGTPIERVATHITRALRERMTKQQSLFQATRNKPIPSAMQMFEIGVAQRAFYQHFPFLKLAHFTANQAILESVRGCSRIHVVDFDIEQGMQWPNLIQTLAQLPEEIAPSYVRITGVGSCSEQHFVELEREDDIDPAVFSKIRCEDGEEEEEEAIAVNCSMFLHRLLGNQLALEKTLCMVKSWKPKIVTVSEIEANHNTASFVDRFVEALHFYSALFDCIEWTLPRTDPDRLCIENTLLATQIQNILACEGADRFIRHTRTENWRDCMHWSGFRDNALSDKALYQAHLFLTLYPPAYKLTRDAQALILGWHDTPIVSVSTWSC